MAPRIREWGSAGWRFLHSVTFAYPLAPTADERARMLAFLRALGDVLPCAACRAHYAAYVAAHTRRGAASAVLASREALATFVVELHNDVNARLGRNRRDYEAVRYEYEVDCGGDPSPWLAALAVAIVVALGVRAATRVDGHV